MTIETEIEYETTETEVEYTVCDSCGCRVDDDTNTSTLALNPRANLDGPEMDYISRKWNEINQGGIPYVSQIDETARRSSEVVEIEVDGEIDVCTDCEETVFGIESTEDGRTATTLTTVSDYFEADKVPVSIRNGLLIGIPVLVVHIALMAYALLTLGGLAGTLAIVVVLFSMMGVLDLVGFTLR